MPPSPRQPGYVLAGLLRLSVVLQCLGNAWWFGLIGETPVFSLASSSPEVGGLGFAESGVRAAHMLLAIVWLGHALALAARPSTALLVSAAALQLALLAAMAWNGPSFHLSIGGELAPGWVETLFVLAAQAMRIACPVACFLLLSDQRGLAMTVMRLATAGTFFAHGLEAVQHYPKFVDMLLTADSRLLGSGLSESTAEAILTVIGVVDIAAALLVVGFRTRAIAWYMAFWGLVTALSRVIVADVYTGGWGVLTRAPHAFVPAAIAIGWMIESRAISHAAAAQASLADTPTPPMMEAADDRLD